MQRTEAYQPFASVVTGSRVIDSDRPPQFEMRADRTQWKADIHRWLGANDRGPGDGVNPTLVVSRARGYSRVSARTSMEDRMGLSPRMARLRMITRHVFQTMIGPTAGRMAWGFFGSRPVRLGLQNLESFVIDPGKRPPRRGKGGGKHIWVVAEISNRAGESRLLEASDAPVGLHSSRSCCMCGYHGIGVERLQPRSSFSMESSTIILFIPSSNTSQSINKVVK